MSRRGGKAERASRKAAPSRVRDDHVANAMRDAASMASTDAVGRTRGKTAGPPAVTVEQLPGGRAAAPAGNASPSGLAETLLAALPHPIVVLGERDRIVSANAAAETFFSSSRAHLQRGRLEDCVAFGSPLLALVAQVRRTGQTVNEYAVELSIPKSGASHLVDLYCGPLAEHPGLLMLVLQQRNMAQMIQRQFTHRAAARSVSGMASVLAHEIKNPLSGIRGAAQLLEQGLADEDRGLTQLICAETDRICDLVDRMEVFGDERPISKEAVNVHDVLSHVRQIAENGFARALAIEEHYDPSLPRIPGNRDALVQALLNLVKNAAEAITGETTRPDTPGRLVLRTSYKPGVRLSVPGSDRRVSLPLMIEIEDDGAGIPETMLGHLFDPFVTTKPNGTGLGLALVAKIIGDHGGIIECESVPRHTVFRVLLPIQAKQR
ncbi:MAG: ATP-binding protein [Pseudomonadota bacterium]